MELSKIKYCSSTTNFKGIKQVQKLVSETLKPETDKIFGQNSCWKLYQPEILEQFIKSDKELTELLSETMELTRTYGLKLSIDMLQKLKNKKPEINKFYELLKTKYNINLETPPKVYRFVGKSEIEALKKDGKVTPQRGYWDKFDVTINPELNWGNYRISFKPKQEFSVLDKTSKMKENLGTGHDYFYLYEGPYNIDDVECIEEVYKHKK